ncbi:MAG TPA: hypothetical protein PKV72_04105 [Candidatus Peribacteria bacterium]|nr:hypothetical protein [Candidatus Peribacteria bacterium]
MQHNPNSGFIIRCKPGAITIWIRNLTNTPYLASLNVGRPVTVGAGLDYSFDLEVGTDGASCLLRWTEIRCAELFFEIS